MARTVGEAELRPLLLTLADGAWHSGERLAETAGLTRAGLAKRMHKLTDLGLELETRTGQGYRLPQPLDLLEPDSIVGALPPEVRGRVPVSVAFSTGSTNRELLDADPARDPRALLAEHQAAGRGRSGRTWHSPFGANLYLSLSWTFGQWPETLTALPLAVGVATAEALRESGLDALGLKWPNDLILEGRKLGGILIEQRSEAGGNCRVVIGLGLNVSMRPSQAGHVLIGQPWIGLREHLGPRTPSRNVLAARVIARWVTMLDRFAREGFVPFAPAWQALDITRQRAVTVQAGDACYSGIAQGVDASGALLVDIGGQRQRLLSGEVSLRLDSAA